MEITQIAGFLGCGKTTLLLKLATMIADGGKRKVALIVNEIGEIPVDGKVIEEGGMTVKDIGGGCICCEVAVSFGKTLVALYKQFNPDYVLVEPTGVAIPHQVKTAAKMGMRDATLTVGAAIVLFDATRPAELLDMDLLGNLVVNQVKDADYLAISKIDAVDPSELDDIARRVKEHNQTAETVFISAFTGEGLDRLVEIILDGKE
jgi:G3E family GTPase